MSPPAACQLCIQPHKSTLIPLSFLEGPSQQPVIEFHYSLVMQHFTGGGQELHMCECARVCTCVHLHILPICFVSFAMVGNITEYFSYTVHWGIFCTPFLPLSSIFQRKNVFFFLSEAHIEGS